MQILLTKNCLLNVSFENTLENLVNGKVKSGPKKVC